MRNDFTLEDLELIEITNAKSDFAKQVLKIYKDAFPIETRETGKEIKSYIKDAQKGKWEIGEIFRILALKLGDKIVAFSMYSYEFKRRLGYIYYIAVQKDVRQLGIGTRMFLSNLEAIKKDAKLHSNNQPLGLCWEVDRPQDVEEIEEQTIREKRIRFYKKCGGILISDVDYLAPPLREGTPELPYYLMFCFADKTETEISVEIIKSIIDILLLKNYGAKKSSKYYQNAINTLPENPVQKDFIL